MGISKRNVVTILGLLFAAGSLPAQTTGSADAQSKTRTLVATFNKFKHVTKNKRGVTSEKYKKVDSEAAVKANPAEYSGVYEVEGMALGLNLTVDRNGVVTGTGYEPLSESVRRTFTLRDGRMQGALLTATKVYAGGGTERLEGAFMNRTSFDSPTAPGVTVFGFGTIGKYIEGPGYTTNRFFYQKSR